MRGVRRGSEADAAAFKEALLKRLERRMLHSKRDQNRLAKALDERELSVITAGLDDEHVATLEAVHKSIVDGYDAVLKRLDKYETTF